MKTLIIVITAFGKYLAQMTARMTSTGTAKTNHCPTATSY